jgi:hypothetical protein
VKWIFAAFYLVTMMTASAMAQQDDQQGYVYRPPRPNVADVLTQQLVRNRQATEQGYYTPEPPPPRPRYCQPFNGLMICR